MFFNKSQGLGFLCEVYQAYIAYFLLVCYSWEHYGITKNSKYRNQQKSEREQRICSAPFFTQDARSGHHPESEEEPL